MTSMFIAYFVFPFAVFLLVHYLYYWLGKVIANPFSRGFKIVFWPVYTVFGITLIYTNMIWSVELEVDKSSLSEVDSSRYERYNKYYSNTNNKYKKLNISGVIDSQLNVEFQVTLINHKKECATRLTVSRHRKDRYSVEETIVYPKMKPGPYSIDIYLENYKQDIDCKFSLKDEIGVRVLGNNREHSVHYAKITNHSDTHKGYRIIGHETATIVCKEGSVGRKAVTECNIVNASDSAPYVPGVTKAIHLDFKTKGQISGDDAYNQTKMKVFPDALSNAVENAFRKFSIGEVPSFDPR